MKMTKTSLFYKKHHVHSCAWHMEDITHMFTELNVQLSFLQGERVSLRQYLTRVFLSKFSTSSYITQDENIGRASESFQR